MLQGNQHASFDAQSGAARAGRPPAKCFVGPARHFVHLVRPKKAWLKAQSKPRIRATVIQPRPRSFEHAAIIRGRLVESAERKIYGAALSKKNQILLQLVCTGGSFSQPA